MTTTRNYLVVLSVTFLSIAALGQVTRTAPAPAAPAQPAAPQQPVNSPRVNPPPGGTLIKPGGIPPDPNMPQDNPAINRRVSPMPILTNPAPISPGINQMPGTTSGLPIISNSFRWNSNTVAPWMTNRPGWTTNHPGWTTNRPGWTTNRPPWITNRILLR